MDYDVSMTSVIEDSFTQYAGATIQSRALVDSRDAVQPSARQILYALKTDGFTHDKPFKKTLKSIGSCMRFYIHGDSSCEGIIMRNAQPFCTRYPLVEVEGSYGNIMSSGNWAAPRYTSSRLSRLSDYLLDNTEEYFEEDWQDNYDDTERYPRVLASLGYYNIVNGAFGIAVGLSSSIPQFNLREVNDALCKLIDDPDVPFDDIYCEPDFATGGTIVNADEVKDALENGAGKPCVIRAKITCGKNVLTVEEMPYGVYTNTVCNEIQKLLNSGKLHPKIVDVKDFTGEHPNLKIYLSKGANAEEVKEFLYKNTSLQSSYSINMMMLENGRFPKVFTWRQALQSHIDHERKTYIAMYERQVEESEHKKKILEGFEKASRRIDEVVSIVKDSESSDEARKSLMSLLDIDDEQAKSILNMRLSRLTKMESLKLEDQIKSVAEKIKMLKDILDSDDLLKKQMKSRLQLVASEFGDDRRTEVINMEIKKTVQKKIENRDWHISFDALGYLKKTPREHEGSHLANDAETFMLFSDKFKCYRLAPKDVRECAASDRGTPIRSVLDLDQDEHIAFICSDADKDKSLVFVTGTGEIKRIHVSEFMGKTRNLRGMACISPKSMEMGFVAAFLVEDEDILFTTKQGYTLRIHGNGIRESKRGTGCVRGVRLRKNDRLGEVRVIGRDEYSSVPVGKAGGYGKIREM